MKYRNKKIVIDLSLLVLFSLALAGCIPSGTPGIKQLTKKFDEIATKQTDDAIKKSPVLQEVESVCKQIPLPPDFEIVKKGGLNDDGLLVLDYYYTSETKYEPARLLWNTYFADNGWEAKKEEDSYPRQLEFNNLKYKVSIQYGGMGDRAQYSIACQKLRSE